MKPQPKDGSGHERGKNDQDLIHSYTSIIKEHGGKFNG